MSPTANTVVTMPLHQSAAAAKMLLLILADHPKIQAKAQAELDAVLGSERLPTIADRPSLPYVHAIVKELGRYYTVNPFGLPHASAEDDEYEGYFIPKGTIIMPNAWYVVTPTHRHPNRLDTY